MVTANHRSSVCMTVFFLSAVLSTAHANTVLWYRFNGEGANVPNVAATADGMPDGTVRATDGTIRSITNYGNPVYGSDAANMPIVTNLFQEVAPRIIDQKTGTVYAGGKTLHFGDRKLNGGVIVQWSTALSNALDRSEFTVEVIARFPVEAAERTNDKMFPLVQFGRDSSEGWLFAVYDGFPWARFNYVRSDGTQKLNDAPTTVKANGYMKDMPSLFDGRWHRLTMTTKQNDAGKVTAEFMVDGVKCGGFTTESAFDRWILSGKYPLAIGCEPFRQASRTFWGDIAEVRISNTKLGDNTLLVPLVNGLVDDDTAVMLSFDSAAKGLGFDRQYMVPCFKTPSQAVQTSTNYVWHARQWNIHNAAYNNPYIPRWFPFAGLSTDWGIPDYFSEALRPTLTNDTWGATYGADATLAANAGALDIPTCQPSGRAAPGTDVINIPDLNKTLPKGDFTIEFVLKTEAASTSEADTFFYCPFLKWCIYNGKVLARCYATSYGSSADITSGDSIADGKWHHVAYTYDKTAGKVRHYLDYKLIGSQNKQLYVVPQQDENENNRRCFIGAQYRDFTSGASGSQAFRGKIDAVRITRRVLTTGEFLSSRSAEPLMTMTFDDAEAPYAAGQEGGIASDAGVAGAYDDGENPRIVDGRAGWYVLDGSNGVDKVECGKAVQFAGSTLYWKNATLLERKSITIEFFAKLTSFTNSASLMRCVRTDAVNGTPVWVFWKTIKEGHLQFSSFPVKSDGTLDTQQNKTIKTEFMPVGGTDTAWHHWALTIDSTDGEHIYAKVYKDYEQFGSTAIIDGTLNVPPLDGNRVGLSIGANGKVYGTFDQIRVSAGILPVDKFMRYEPKPRGLVVTIR